jgi:hypothetical protein
MTDVSGSQKSSEMKLPPDQGIAHMRHVFDQHHAKPRGTGPGPSGEPVVSTATAAPGGADTVIKIVAGGPGPNTTVSDGGGRKMTRVNLYVIFWGDSWNSVPVGSPTMSDVYNDIASVLASPFLEGLEEYTPFSTASLTKAYFVHGYNPRGDFNSVDVDYVAWYMMTYGPIPNGDSNTIVCVMMPPGITNPKLYGSHSYTTPPSLNTVPVMWVLYRARADISCAFTHELVETITDPEGTGIQVNPRGMFDWNEIGDACNLLCQSINA